jgi:hypothetical protein
LPCCLVVAGFLIGAWLFRSSPAPQQSAGPAPGGQPASPEARTSKQAKPLAKVDVKLRSLNLPGVIKRHEQAIRQLEERCRLLERENENLDRRIVSLQEAPRYRLSASEIDSRGKEANLLLLNRLGNSRLKEDLEKRIESLREELEKLRDEYRELQLHQGPAAVPDRSPTEGVQ